GHGSVASSLASMSGDDGADVLAAWMLTDRSLSRTPLGSMLAPVRAAVGDAFDVDRLAFDCSNPDLDVSIASSDLQILMINMLLTCRDAVGIVVDAKVRIDDVMITETDELSRLRLGTPGHYLMIRVSVRGSGTQVPVLVTFANCANLARGMGGVLS